MDSPVAPLDQNGCLVSIFAAVATLGPYAYHDLLGQIAAAVDGGLACRQPETSGVANGGLAALLARRAPYALRRGSWRSAGAWRSGCGGQAGCAIRGGSDLIRTPPAPPEFSPYRAARRRSRGLRRAHEAASRPDFRHLFVTAHLSVAPRRRGAREWRLYAAFVYFLIALSGRIPFSLLLPSYVSPDRCAI